MADASSKLGDADDDGPLVPVVGNVPVSFGEHVEEVVGAGDTTTSPQPAQMENNHNNKDEKGKEEAFAVSEYAQTKCSICLERYTVSNPAVILEPCQHAFHLQCVESWRQRSRQCPVCFAPIEQSAGGVCSARLMAADDVVSLGRRRSTARPSDGGLKKDSNNSDDHGAAAAAAADAFELKSRNLRSSESPPARSASRSRTNSQSYATEGGSPSMSVAEVDPMEAAMAEGMRWTAATALRNRGGGVAAGSLSASPRNSPTNSSRRAGSFRNLKALRAANQNQSGASPGTSIASLSSFGGPLLTQPPPPNQLHVDAEDGGNSCGSGQSGESQRQEGSSQRHRDVLCAHSPLRRKSSKRSLHGGFPGSRSNASSPSPRGDGEGAFASSFSPLGGPPTAAGDPGDIGNNSFEAADNDRRNRRRSSRRSGGGVEREEPFDFARRRASESGAWDHGDDHDDDDNHKYNHHDVHDEDEQRLMLAPGGGSSSTVGSGNGGGTLKRRTSAGAGVLPSTSSTGNLAADSGGGGGGGSSGDHQVQVDGAHTWGMSARRALRYVGTFWCCGK